MRSEHEVQDRIRYLLTRELDARLEWASEKLPHLCMHNYRHQLDVRKVVLGEPNEQYNRVEGRHLPVIGLCMLGSDDVENWPGNTCEDPIDAQRCPFFDAKRSPETVQAEFKEQIQNLEWVEANLPEVFGLLWALGSETLPKLPWWKRLWYRVLQMRPDGLNRPQALSTGH